MPSLTGGSIEDHQGEVVQNLGVLEVEAFDIH